MKTLKTKQINVAVCWAFLKSIPPKKFDSMLDIERSVPIIRKLAEAIPDFVEHRIAGEEFNRKVIKGEIKDGEKIVRKFFFFKQTVVQTAGQIVEEWHRAYDIKTEQIGDNQGKEIVEVEFEDAEFNTFFGYCGNKEWGAKNWFVDVPAYLEFLKNLDAANQQPKDK